MKSTSGHIVLVGDSIFDNQRYTRGEPDVVTHLRSLLPPNWQATLCAIDGTTTLDLSPQFSRIPADGTHLVLSLGGNDALMNIDLLEIAVTSSGHALRIFGERLDRFEANYCRALQALARHRKPLTVCTIYNGALEPEQLDLARVALMMFNDVIVRAAVAHRAAIIELRTVCTDPADYANPIEPSGSGGRKIAHIIARAVGAVAGEDSSRIFGS